MGAEDVGYIWCCMADNALTEALSPHLKLYRAKTLMMGDDHYDYCWKWEE
jgi:L-2-amino-thiazoline-4-carboxylic acid hydrolase